MPTPAHTSLEAIVRAARDVLETEGRDGLTMQAVAARVGVRAPSLYKRVRGRAELVGLVAGDVARDLGARLEAVARTGDAASDLRAEVRAFRRFAHEHPEAHALLFAPAATDGPPDPAANASALETILRTTAALAGPHRALDAARTVTAWAHGFVTMELAGAFRLGGDVDAAFEYGVERIAAAMAADGARGPVAPPVDATRGRASPGRRSPSAP